MLLAVFMQLLCFQTEMGNHIYFVGFVLLLLLQVFISPKNFSIPRNTLAISLHALIIFGNGIKQMSSLMYLFSQQGLQLDSGIVCLGHRPSVILIVSRSS